MKWVVSRLVKRIVPDGLALQVVAWLILVNGFARLLGFILAYGNGHGSFPLDVLLGVAIFFGLRARINGWRIAAMICLMIPLLLYPVVAILIVVPGLAAAIQVTTSGSFETVDLYYMGVVWVIALWMFTVLLRPSVRSAFKSRRDVIA